MLPLWNFSSGCLVMSLYVHAFILLHAHCTTSVAVVTGGKKMKKAMQLRARLESCSVQTLTGFQWRASIPCSNYGQSQNLWCSWFGAWDRNFNHVSGAFLPVHFQGHGGYFSIRMLNQFSRCCNHLKLSETCLYISTLYIHIYSPHDSARVMSHNALPVQYGYGVIYSDWRWLVWNEVGTTKEALQGTE